QPQRRAARGGQVLDAKRLQPQWLHRGREQGADLCRLVRHVLVRIAPVRPGKKQGARRAPCPECPALRPEFGAEASSRLDKPGFPAPTGSLSASGGPVKLVAGAGFGRWLREPLRVVLSRASRES